jgi:hypothetical protein
MDNFVKSVQIYPYHCFFNQANGMIIHNHINVSLFVIPGLTRNPVFPWIPASAGMTMKREGITLNYEKKVSFYGMSPLPLRERVRVRGVLAQVESIKIDVPYFRRNDDLWVNSMLSRI